MQKPLTIEGYLASRYIVRPMHLFDMCLVNDGAVCLIVSRADRARDMPHAPVLVAGWGESVLKQRKMQVMVRERLRPLMQDAGAQALAMAAMTLSDVQHFEGYDASTMHLVDQIEGYGFAAPGEGLEFCKAGEMTFGGRIPTNMGGGNLSGSYMHGWSQVAEVARQLRHEAGERQVEGVEVSMSSLAQTDAAHPIVFVRG
jgi:acetyl-CoA acetyltransferase